MQKCRKTIVLKRNIEVISHIDLEKLIIDLHVTLVKFGFFFLFAN